MRSRRKANPRVIAVLKLPQYQVPFFLVRARAIADAMDQNPWFPGADPPPPVLRAAIADVAQAEAATYSSKDAVSARNEKRNALNRLLKRACAYVQRIADANPEHARAIIESASMYVKEPSVVPARTFTARDGPVSGTAEVDVPVAGDRATYELSHSIDGMKTWIVHPSLTSSTFVVDGLTPGSTVWFRYRASVKKMTGDYSNPISLIIR